MPGTERVRESKSQVDGSCVLCWVHNSKQANPEVKRFFDHAVHIVTIRMRALSSPKFRPDAERTLFRYQEGLKEDFRLERRMVDHHGRSEGDTNLSRETADT